MKMTGNTILITGGTSGIGLALAEAFHEKGNKVIVAGRRQNLLDEITARNSGMVGIAVDVSSSASIREFTQKVQKQFPELNVLVNNAGMSKREDFTADTVDTSIAMDTIQTNIVSVVEITAQLLPLLRKQKEAALIATTSGLAFTPLPSGPTYSATKAFLHSWLSSLRYQLRNSSVEVLELAPPYVQTELGGPQQAKDPRAMPLKDFTDEVMKILSSGKTERGEILVERVLPLRWSERDGKYDELLNMLGQM